LDGECGAELSPPKGAYQFECLVRPECSESRTSECSRQLFQGVKTPPQKLFLIRPIIFLTELSDLLSLVRYLVAEIRLEKLRIAQWGFN
jgi:hypothetical protein